MKTPTFRTGISEGDSAEDARAVEDARGPGAAAGEAVAGAKKMGEKVGVNPKIENPFIKHPQITHRYS